MKRLFYVMKEIEPEGMDEERMEDFLGAIRGVSNVLFHVERRRQEGHKQVAAGKLIVQSLTDAVVLLCGAAL